LSHEKHPAVSAPAFEKPNFFYRAKSLRLAIPNKPIAPLPSNARLDGSGTDPAGVSSPFDNSDETLSSIPKFPLVANIPSIASGPHVSAPVVRFSFPGLSAIRVELPFQPITEARVGPINVRPAFVPDNVLALLNSMEFVADAEVVTEMKQSNMTAMATNFPGYIEQTPYTADCESSSF
jgi:hypothetical protein